MEGEGQIDILDLDGERTTLNIHLPITVGDLTTAYALSKGQLDADFSFFYERKELYDDYVINNNPDRPNTLYAVNMSKFSEKSYPAVQYFDDYTDSKGACFFTTNPRSWGNHLPFLFEHPEDGPNPFNLLSVLDDLQVRQRGGPNPDDLQHAMGIFSSLMRNMPIMDARYDLDFIPDQEEEEISYEENDMSFID